MTDDLAVWLLAQIDTDARVASEIAAETGGAHWQALECDQCAGHVATQKQAGEEYPQCIAECYPHEGGGLNAPAHHHMASWDPARVLAECDSKRRIIEMHKPESWMSWDDDAEVETEKQYCLRCATGASCSCCLEEKDQVWPCDTLKLLALPFAGRPGYRQAWMLT